MKHSIVYVQSGGPTTVINSSLYGAIAEARKHPEVEHFYGARNGIEGLIDGSFIDLFKEDQEQIELLLQTPGAALGSSRKSIPADINDPVYEEVLATFKKFGVTCVLFNGGNDSMDTCDKLGKFFQAKGEPIQCIGVPKTIDNDLVCTDHCPGFGSAAKMVINTTLSCAIDAASFRKSKIYVIETMGRNAGWVAASAALIPAPYTPDLVLTPEMTPDADEVGQLIKNAYEKKGYAVVVMAEGVMFEELNNVPTDSFGHACLDGTSFGLIRIINSVCKGSTRQVILSTPNRAAPAYGSLTDIKEAQGAGATAVKLALEGKSRLMVTILRDEGPEYKVHYGSCNVSEVANAVKTIPTSWIRGYEGFTKDLENYIRPLILGEPELKVKDGVIAFTNFKGIKPEAK